MDGELLEKSFFSTTEVFRKSKIKNCLYLYDLLKSSLGPGSMDKMIIDNLGDITITNDGASFSTQLIGIVAIGAFVLITSFILWYAVKAILGVRLSETEEKDGADKSEIGLASYPEFTQ